MEKKIFVNELGGKIAALNKCKELVLNDMKNDSHCLIESWDGVKCNVTPEEHFNNIIEWCRTKIKSYVWSCHKSTKYTWQTSYGAKHECERKLKCYVANNWMKMAMICAGCEVCNINCIDYETGYVNKMPIKLSDIITNNQNFIVRKPKDPINLEYMICDWTYELKYRCGGYNGHNF